MNSPLWSPALVQLEPYVPGEQPRGQRLVKLNTNENPYPPSPRALEVLADTQLVDALRRYPDPESTDLRAAIAARFGLRSGQVFVGNGSDEVLAHSFYSFFRRDEPLLFPDITYSFYPVYCQLYDIQYRTPALREDFSVAVEDYAGPAAGVILPNPNAPSGRHLPLEQIEQLLQQRPDRVVVIDEAYIDFAGEAERYSAVSLIHRYPNLLVIHTLSKSYSLAGLRLGFAMGQEPLIEGLNRTKNSFNSYPIDAIAQRLATAAIGDSSHLAQCCRRVMATRERVTAALTELGFDLVPSKANFLLARPPGISAASLYEALRQQGILVRHFNKPRISDYLRISIGTDEDMDALLRNCREIIGSQTG